MLDSFNARCTRVKTWLEGAELYFEAKDEYAASPVGKKRLQALLAEISDYNEVVRKLREEAEELMKADERYALIVQPQMLKLSERWNAIVDKLQEKAGNPDSVIVELNAFLERMEAIERRVNDVCLIQKEGDVLEECANFSKVCLSFFCGESHPSIHSIPFHTIQFNRLNGAQNS